MDAAALVRDYYAAIDQDRYETLASLLAPEFVHERPDRTLTGRERFVEFMQFERPQTDTTHAVDRLIVDSNTVAAEGRLLQADETLMFRFVDVHETADGQILNLRTYTA